MTNDYEPHSIVERMKLIYIHTIFRFTDFLFTDFLIVKIYFNPKINICRAFVII